MSENNNLPQKKDDTGLALQKTNRLLSITNKILPNKTQTKEVSNQQRIGKFIVQDGIATDTETGLTWLRFQHGQTWQNNTVVGEAETVVWKAAFEVAKQFNQQGGYAGFTDWRLPTIDELKTLLEKDRNENGCYINAGVFPHYTHYEWWVWSSSPSANSSNLAWVVFFSNGSGFREFKGHGYSVRLMRVGQ